MLDTPVVAKTDPVREAEDTRTKPKISRIKGFDLARGLAVVFMVFIHVFDFYGQPALHDSAIGYTLEFLGRSPAAPVFMFIMGIFVVFPGQQSIRLGLKRAVWLFALGYVLNVMRGTLPMWLSLQMGLVTNEQLGGYTPVTEFLVGDILQFAGLAYAACCLSFRYFASPKYWVGAALLIAFFSPLFWKLSQVHILNNALSKLLWGSQDQGAMFPLFPWLAFPLVGMAFGWWLKQNRNTARYLYYSMFIGCALLLVGSLITITDLDFHMGDYFRSGPGMVIWNIGFVLVWLWVCYKIAAKLGSNSVFNALFFLSKNVTVVYVMQWLIIGWGLMLVGSQKLSLANTLLAMALVLLLSYLGTRLWLLVKNRG